MFQNPVPPFYRALADYLSEHEISTYSPQVIREAVIDIRTHKLPDPGKVANNGSFFANPIIDSDLLIELQAEYPGLPQWPDAMAGLRFRQPG